jgi:hypothetical protein
MSYKTELPTGATANLVTQFGITTGRVTVWAANLGTDPTGFYEAVHATGQPVADTAIGKPYEKHDRPDDPSLRHVALTADHAARVLAYVAPSVDEHERAPVAA